MGTRTYSFPVLRVTMEVDRAGIDFKLVIAFQLSTKCIKICGSFSYLRKNLNMSKKGREKRDSDISRESLYAQILAALTKTPDQGFNYKQIAKRLNIIDAPGRQMISDILRDLAKQGSVPVSYTHLTLPTKRIV